VLADALGMERFEVCGSDISSAVLARAASGHYPCERLEHVPEDYLKRYVWKGVGRQAGTVLVDRKLRARTTFFQANLLQAQATLGSFDVIFLRNVLIYFDPDTRRRVVARAAERLVRGGLFVVSHAESLNAVSTGFAHFAPGMYRKL
jgi:chemotaxis protein methyltransferase CheR